MEGDPYNEKTSSRTRYNGDIGLCSPSLCRRFRHDWKQAADSVALRADLNTVADAFGAKPNPFNTDPDAFGSESDSVDAKQGVGPVSGQRKGEVKGQRQGKQQGEDGESSSRHEQTRSARAQLEARALLR